MRFLRNLEKVWPEGSSLPSEGGTLLIPPKWGGLHSGKPGCHSVPREVRLWHNTSQRAGEITASAPHSLGDLRCLFSLSP